jgi:hypothetical protein
VHEHFPESGMTAAKKQSLRSNTYLPVL